MSLNKTLHSMVKIIQIASTQMMIYLSLLNGKSSKSMIKYKLRIEIMTLKMTK